MKLLDIIRKLIKEQQSLSELQVWVTPDNKLIRVTDHMDYLRDMYNDHRELRYAQLHDRAYQEGWVKFHVYPGKNHDEITINALTNRRGADVMAVIMKSILLKYAPGSIFLETAKPYHVKKFSTASSEDIFRLKQFIEKTH